jgi:hypothetical protein
MANSRVVNTFEDELSSEKVFCANCVHCKLMKLPLGGASQYQLRVRCDAGKWRKKLGEEKVYKYFTLMRRILDQCDTYEPMGDEEGFLKELRRELPIKDEIYTP